MADEPKKQVFWTRPQDRSLEAYKAFITNIVNRINPDAPDTMTEEMWEKAWKEFWSKADSPQDQNPPSD